MAYSHGESSNVWLTSYTLVSTAHHHIYHQTVGKDDNNVIPLDICVVEGIREFLFIRYTCTLMQNYPLLTWGSR